MYTVLDEIELTADVFLQRRCGVGQKIVPKVIDHRPMLISELGDTELVGNAQCQVAIPEIGIDEKAIVIKGVMYLSRHIHCASSPVGGKRRK